MKNQCVVSLGFFDGVHLGHQALLLRCVRLAAALGVQPAAITFSRHPQALFTDTPPALLTSVEDREALLRRYGIEEVHRLPVTEAVMSTPWEAFLRGLLYRGAVGFVCGRDFRFGHRGGGTAEKLEKFCADRGLPCVIVEDQTLDGVRVSSSHIRQLLEAGDVETANRFLGHPHLLSGPVVSGRRLGRTIGVPTANLQLPEGVLCPRFGVYACVAEAAGKRYAAVTNIGTRPTVGGHHATVEPWLLDFEGDLYGKPITLEFHAFLREERKFPTLEALKEAIRENEREAREILNSI